MSWMAWTLPTALFFSAIGLALLFLTVFELRSPTRLTKGFLPMQTTRGDRFFISLLSAAFIHLLWLGTLGGALWGASLLAVLWAVLLMRWG
jgi:predicted small integral membrane protein